MADFSGPPLWLIFIASLFFILSASEVGHRYGLTAGVRSRENISTLEGAILGLLALMIGFTFAMALSRFEARREAVLIEANAIGTTALRARLLPAPHNSECLRLLREYVQIRLDITRRSRLSFYTMGVLVCAMILLIQDLDRPNAGFIKVSQQPIIDTAASIAAFPD
jgi:hypothetical protein